MDAPKRRYRAPAATRESTPCAVEAAEAPDVDIHIEMVTTSALSL